MRLFRRLGGRYVAHLDRAEATILASLVDQTRDLLSARRAEVPDDPLAELTGIAAGPAQPPDDPALARLLPDYVRDDTELSAGLRMLHEPELLAAKDAAAVAVLDSVPAGGGTIRLDEPTAAAWLASLNDVRLVLGARLEITEDDQEPAAATAPEGSQPFALWAAYRFLSAIQESLVRALTGD